MAKTLLDPKVGDYAYKPFEIMKPGKVTGVSASGSAIEVTWMDGTTSVHMVGELKDFNHATDEHLSKYQKFDQLRTRLSLI